MNTKILRRTFFVVLLSALFLLNGSCKFLNQVFAEKIFYTMVDVNGDDAHILRFKDGSVYLIDVGQGNKMAAYMNQNNIKSADKIFISHAHKDHYNGIFGLIGSGVKIGTVYFNIPDKEVCDREKPWGCDYDHVLHTIKFIRDRNIPVETLNAGDTFHPQDNAVLKVLAVYDGSNSPVGKTDINDASAIMKLSYGNITVLFPGDLNRNLSEYLIKAGYDVKADILKVPHHGAEGVATNNFFDTVSPKLALVPAPKDLWLSDRSKRIRDYFAGKNVPVLVSGIDGDVTVILYKDKYEVDKLR